MRPGRLTRGAALKARIANARRSVAYADTCVKEARTLGFPAAQLAVIEADADAVREPARKLLQILLNELENK